MSQVEQKEKKIKSCDNTSVGMIVRKDGKVLLLERMKPPYGFAPPAGHVDEDLTPQGEKDFETAARRELEEEVSLKTKDLKQIYEGRQDNSCRRPGGNWHYWKIYEIETEGELHRSLDETKQARWYSPEEVAGLGEKTKIYLKGEVSDEEWQKNPGLEVFWYRWGLSNHII